VLGGKVVGCAVALGSTVMGGGTVVVRAVVPGSMVVVVAMVLGGCLPRRSSHPSAARPQAALSTPGASVSDPDEPASAGSPAKRFTNPWLGRAFMPCLLG
jgi:hypothetical protein